MNGPVRTTCPYCGTGCGVIASPGAGGGWKIEGDPKHPANFGKLCAKGNALGATLGAEGRLLYPEISGRRASWDQALDLIASRFKEIAEKHGSESIAFYLSGQLLTEDYYVANKLAKGFIGTPHVDTNSRLCMASSVAGHKRAFGADTVPGCYEDLDVADLIVLVGSNAAWNHPILFQRMLASKRERGAKLISIDVRETATTQASDLALIIAPGTDAWLFNGLLAHLAGAGAIDKDYVARHTSGFDAALETARASAPDVRTVARATGLTIARLRRFYELFATTERVVTCFSQGINQSSTGSDKVNAILNCHLATGRIGKPGAGPFSLTGQPNAMGGREVGGLANQLAAHMDFDDAALDRVGRFWKAPRLIRGQGLKAVQMFDAVHDGKIKALWVLCTNPAASLPNANRAIEALARCEFLVVSDCVGANDTMAHAHVKLPAAGWGEKAGTVTNSERRISRQRAIQLHRPARPRPIGGRWRRSAVAWDSRERSRSGRLRMSFENTRRFRRSRITAAGISISRAWPNFPTRPTRGSRRCSGRCRKIRRPGSRGCSAMAISFMPTARRALSRSRRAAWPSRLTKHFRSLSTPVGCGINGTP